MQNITELEIEFSITFCIFNLNQKTYKSYIPRWMELKGKGEMNEEKELKT